MVSAIKALDDNIAKNGEHSYAEVTERWLTTPNDALQSLQACVRASRIRMA